MATAPHYDQWRLDLIPEAERNGVFKNDILPMIATHAGGGPLRELVNDNPWLRDFLRNARLQNAVEAYERSPNETTNTLADFVKVFVCTMITVEWQRGMNNEIAARFE